MGWGELLPYIIISQQSTCYLTYSEVADPCIVALIEAKILHSIVYVMLVTDSLMGCTGEDRG